MKFNDGKTISAYVRSKLHSGYITLSFFLFLVVSHLFLTFLLLIFPFTYNYPYIIERTACVTVCMHVGTDQYSPWKVSDFLLKTNFTSLWDILRARALTTYNNY